MFEKKTDVDRHVEFCLKNVHSESERNLRSLAFAKLYFNVGAYEMAKRYVSNYLNAKPKSAEAQLLLGKIYEKMGRRETALEAYRNSLDINPKQNTLIIKVCELLASDDVTLDATRARFWTEQAEQVDPHNPALVNLRARLATVGAAGPDEVRQLFIKELEHRPTDVGLRIRLLQHLLQHNQLSDAYKHVTDIENKYLSIFTENVTWYETVTTILVRYRNENSNNSSLTWEFWMFFVSILEKLASLILDESITTSKHLSECVNAVFNLDQTLYIAAEKIIACTEKQFVQEFLTHYRAQLCFHLATLVLKLARKEQMTYAIAVKLAMPLLLTAYHAAPVELHCVWLEYADESRKKQVTFWHRQAAFRCSQTGHILLGFNKHRRSSFGERIQQLMTGAWRERTHKSIFITRDQQIKTKSSYFYTCTQMDEIPTRLPDQAELLRYDEVAQLVRPSSLHHIIWIGINNDPASFRTSVFDGLQYTVRNLNNCSAESLNVLDIQAFLYCCIFCIQSNNEESKHSIFYNPEKPAILPASITEPYGTVNQTKWYLTVYKMFKHECESAFTDARVTVLKGIEIVRCCGPHGLDAKLLVMLAMTFAARARKLGKSAEVEALETRAELYWQTALPLLEKLRNNQAVVYPSIRWFEYRGKEMTPTEINIFVEEGKLFLAQQLMKKKDHEKAIELLATLKNPYASFYQAKTYKLLANELTSHNKENLTSEMRSQHIIMLSKARDCFYLTLDRLREPSVDRKHPLNADLASEIEEIERLLSGIDPDTCINRNECDGMSDENVSSVGSVGEPTGYGLLHSTYNGTSHGLGPATPRHEVHHTTLLGRREARPSPERLDAQLRQMAAARDATTAHILDQNRLVLEAHRALQDEIRCFKDSVAGLTVSVNNLMHIKQSVDDLKIAVDDLKHIKNSVDELKLAVDDLQNMKEQVYEIKKDMTELKKDTNKLKNTQINEEDLYALEEEYGVEYNINPAGAAGFNSGALYPNFQQRLQSTAANTLAYGAPGLYPSLYPMYPYGSLGLGQPAALPFADGHVPDFRALQPPPAPAAAPTLATNLFAANKDAATFGKFDNANIPLPLLQPSVPAPLPAAVPAPLPATLPAPVVAPITSQHALNKAPPVNVVITASDPLPTTSASLPVLSVTIPPQHLKGNQSKTQPHNYQIPITVTTQPVFTNVANTITSAPMPVATQNLLSNVAPPVYSSLTVNSPSQSSGNGNKGLGLQIEKSLTQSFSTPNTTLDNLNKSNVSENSVIEEHDPCPDFKPIIPLPDEVPVMTGEEGENILFCQHAKLYRYVDKEWRERGIGNIKILHNGTTNKVRILMRRDQVHKICANHFLNSDIQLNPMPKNERAYIWAVNDFADENMVLEKFCVRFKTVEEAKKFADVFEYAKTILKSELDKKESLDQIDTENKKSESKESNNSLGGFVFTSTPTFKPKIDIVDTITKQTTEVNAKPSPFASFSFGTPNPKLTSTDFKPVQKLDSPICTPKDTSLVNPKPVIKQTSVTEEQDEEEFVPTTEFKPVIPLPDLVEVKTGEENYEVLYEVKAKLLRFDSAIKEWKERGVGMMKILKDKTIRLLMRREQIHKVCCNHQLLKTMVFTNMPKNNRVLNWCAQDFSENVIKTEMFAIRFRTPELCEEFLQMIHKAQDMLDSSSNVITNVSSTFTIGAGDGATSGWGDKFKPKQGSWECNVCYVSNTDNNKCIACGSSRDEEESNTQEAQSPQKFKPSPSLPTITPSPKPKQGTWQCKVCFIHNDGKNNYCEACDSPKNDTLPKKDSNIDMNASGPQFSFGSTASNFGLSIATSATPTTNTTTTTSGWGDFFKPKAGAWECKACYISNDASLLYCIACESPKDDSVPKKENKGIDLSTGSEQKFTFGIPSSITKPTESIFGGKPQVSAGFSFGMNTTTPVATDFTLGVQKPTESSLTTGFSFGSPATTTSDTPLNLVAPSKATFTFTLSKSGETKKEEFVFGSPNKHEFEFKPRSPRKVSGSGDGDESDGVDAEEECDNIYFKPVIPLPDKVEVRTGEEDETVLYCHRAKLFRFTNGEWKERGIGDVKILRHPDTNKLRVLMRREQVHKICLNHSLTKDIDYTAKDDHTWLFSVADYSDGEISFQQLCLRFKNADIATQFMTALNKARNSYTNTIDAADKKQKNESDPDLEIVYEIKVPADLQEKALKLQLPKNFYAYLQKEPCKGCCGCNDDTFEFSMTKAKKEDSSKPITELSTTHVLETPKTNIFTGNNISTPNSTNTTTSTFTPFSSPFDKFVTPKTTSASSNIFGGSGSLLFGTTTITPVKNDAPTLTSLLTQSQTSTSQANQSSEHKSPLAPSKLSTALSSTSTIFGSTPTTQSSNMFGGKPATPSTPPLSQMLNANKSGAVFGSGSSIFSGVKSEANIFSGSPKTDSNNIFGNLATSTNLFSSSNNSVFSTPTQSVFGNSFSFNQSDKPPIFGNVSNTPSFGSIAQPKQVEPVLKCDINLSFAALASGSQTFATKTEDTQTKPFSFAGAGSLVFGYQKGKNENDKKIENKSITQEGEDDEDAGEERDDNYDPHYEPIVPLPDAIVVKTGEEDETVLFNERAKLFRYTAETKEWKERGVGQMKILYHPDNYTYRLLLRREQVHKLVLNQLISADMDLQSLQSSDRAWCWAGFNYSEDGGQLEKLAIKFKNPDIATQFRDAVVKAQECIKNKPPVTTVQQEKKEQEEEEDNEEDEDQEDEYGSEDSDENRSVMFCKRCTLSYKTDEGGEWKVLGMGVIKMIYDSDMYGAKIEVLDDAGTQLSNTIIAINTLMKVEDTSCIWRSMEWSLPSPAPRILRALFSSSAAAQEMYYNYEEALQYAQHSEIVDTLPN